MHMIRVSLAFKQTEQKGETGGWNQRNKLVYSKCTKLSNSIDVLDYSRLIYLAKLTIMKDNVDRSVR